MAKVKRMINKKGRLTPLEYSLLACFKFDETNLKVDFKGLAIDEEHAAKIIAGSEKFASSIRKLADGVTRKFNGDARRWYVVRLLLNPKRLVDPHEIIRQLTVAQAIAETKLATVYLLEANELHRKHKDNPNVLSAFDSLHHALRHINSDIPDMKAPRIKEGDDLNIEDPPEEWNIFAVPND